MTFLIYLDRFLRWLIGVPPRCYVVWHHQPEAALETEAEIWALWEDGNFTGNDA